MSVGHLACAVSARYLPHAAAMIHSVLEHSPGREVHVHLLHGSGLRPRQIARLSAMVDHLHSHRFRAKDLTGLGAHGRFPVEIWYRVFLPELLPDVDQLLYLDADVIAVDDLSALWDTRLNTEEPVGAVTNVFGDWDAEYPRKLGLPEPRAYFNSGVLLMNLGVLRSQAAGEAVLRCARRLGTRLFFGDQDALNLVTAGRWRPLHPRWNAMNALFTFDHAPEVLGVAAAAEARERPALRHFEGPDANKPWHPGSEVPHRDAYLRHRAATPWPLRGRRLRP